MDITVWFMQLDDEYSQSQAIHTPIQKGHAVLQHYLLTEKKMNRPSKYACNLSTSVLTTERYQLNRLRIISYITFSSGKSLSLISSPFISSHQSHHSCLVLSSCTSMCNAMSMTSSTTHLLCSPYMFT